MLRALIALAAMVVPAPWSADDRAIASGPVRAALSQTDVSAADVAAAIDTLGSFDLATRTGASRTVRRAPAAIAVPALTRAARQHPEGYVRYRALVLLAGFGDAPAAGVMREMMADRNDRLRTVAYQWFEFHPEPSVVPLLVDALGREQSPFVRPALLRALAVYGKDPVARAAVFPFVMRGDDAFRSAVINALGDYGGVFALDALIELAPLDGPLQDDAVTAIGRIGDQAGRAVLVDVQRTGPRDVQPAVAAALFLLGSNAASNEEYLKRSLQFGAQHDGFEPLLRGAANGLSVLAIRDHRSALAALLDAGVAARGLAREIIALSVGRVALRNPEVMMQAVEPRADTPGVLELLHESFDMLSSEDYALERFYVHVRRAHWAAAPGSPLRRLTEAMIQKLEF